MSTSWHRSLAGCGRSCGIRFLALLCLLFYDISPHGNLIFIALRGPNPLTGNNPAFNNAVGNTPGLGIIRVKEGGRLGKFFARVPISHFVDGVERADPHGLRVLVK